MARPSRWPEVVQAAELVFRRRGFARASLEEIAEELGVWKGSLYNYISTKEDLLVACHVAVLVGIYDFAAVYLHEVAGRDPGPEYAALDREYAALVEGVVVEGVAAGVFPAARDPHLTTMTLLGALNWLTRWWDPNGAIGPDLVAAQISDMVLAGVPAATT